MMKIKKQIFMLFALLLVVGLVLSGCSHTPTSTDDDKSTTDDTATDNDVTFGDEDSDENSEDEDVEEEETVDETEDTEDDVTEDSTTDEEETETPDTTTTTDGVTVTNDGSAKGSISGKFCYPSSPIPSNLRVYVKNAKSGYYWYVSAKTRTTWEITDLDPATYNVYLAGPDGSGLSEGRYLNTDNSWKSIVLKAGDKVSGVSPCDFDF